MSKSFRLGLFILTTLAILTVCVFLIGRQQSTFGANFRVNSEFENVAGLSEGADVRVGGIRKGTVGSIRLPKRPDEKVLVSMDLESVTRAIVKQDSVASIESAGLLGDKYVEISFGSVEAPSLKGGDTIESEPPLDVADLFQKANRILDTGQGALEGIQGSADNLNLITAKINSGHGTVGRLINDPTLYKQATASVTSMSDSATALKHNFFLRGFFKNRGYENPAEIQAHAVAQLPPGQPIKSFTFDPKNLFAKPDSAKLKNQKSLDVVGKYLQGNAFALAVIVTSTGATGDSDKQLVLSEARSFVVRKYLVEQFPMNDTHLKTLGQGKASGAQSEGSVEIRIYATALPPTPAAVRK